MTLSFEEKIKNGLVSCGIKFEEISPENPLGVAVSGGADSVSLLLSLSKILPKNSVKAITVNHGIRKEEETDGDAEFVKNLCSSLGIFCREYVCKQGEIQKLAEKREKGIEEAARFIRYQFFDDFIESENISFLCLAHHQGDVVETVLMRILNGSGVDGLSGILNRRGKITRPMLEISRKEIEAYLTENDVEWRTDSTNLQNDYSRNKVRNLLIPFLDENFGDWEKNLLSISEKIQTDRKFFENESSVKFREILVSSESKKIVLNGEKFYSLDLAVQQRIIYKALNAIGFGERFPYKLVKNICSWEKLRNQRLTFDRICCCYENGELSFFFTGDLLVSTGFSFLFKEENDSFEIGKLSLCMKKGSQNCLCIDDGEDALEISVDFPFVVRSPQPGDEVKTSGGKMKRVNAILGDWKLSEGQKNQVLVVQKLDSNLEIKALIAFHLCSKNWIVS